MPQALWLMMSQEEWQHSQVTPRPLPGHSHPDQVGSNQEVIKGPSLIENTPNWKTPSRYPKIYINLTSEQQ